MCALALWTIRFTYTTSRVETCTALHCIAYFQTSAGREDIGHLSSRRCWCMQLFRGEAAAKVTHKHPYDARDTCICLDGSDRQKCRRRRQRQSRLRQGWHGHAHGDHASIEHYKCKWRRATAQCVVEQYVHVSGLERQARVREAQAAALVTEGRSCGPC